MTINRSIRRLIGLVAILISIPVILIIDQYLTPWRVPSRIMYAIPIMIAARFYNLKATLLVIAVALIFSVLDAFLIGLELQTEILSLLALIAISGLSIFWARAESQVAALAEEQARLREEEEDIPRLFQPYSRPHRTSGTKGLGLGLYIVKGIVEAHGGNISVKNELGRGTTFTVELPLE
mgnify:CR=1 FL=1